MYGQAVVRSDTFAMREQHDASTGDVLPLG
jgi:hypothetical protein